ncbi:hypothetical protein MPSEU_000708600 [Mayamaea pseudoterrestris]|nr:hypothetical protein MPSEU_000708600 [Mayamaea pseudoterrestris]
MNKEIKPQAIFEQELTAEEEGSVEEGAHSNSSSIVHSPERSETKDREAETLIPPKADEENQSASPLADTHAFSELDNADLPTYVREHNTTLSFPEKLMLMLMHAERLAASTGKRPEEMPIGWVNNGLAFVIRSKTELVSGWLTLFFRQAKFSSFTRKLYRWGFRQVNNAGVEPTLSPPQHRDSVMYFGNENFQRENKARLANMRSVTAAGRRREQAEQAQVTAATESKEQDFYHRMSLEQRGNLHQSHLQHLLPHSNQMLNNNASLLQLRNTQAALASLGGMDQHSNPLLHQSHPLLQQAVARAQLQQQQQQQQQLAAQRLAQLNPQDSLLLLQLTQLLNQPQPASPLQRQLLALQQLQQPQQLQPQVAQPDTEQHQRQELMRGVYEMLLQQIPLQGQADVASFVPPRSNPPPPPDESE